MSNTQNQSVVSPPMGSGVQGYAPDDTQPMDIKKLCPLFSDSVYVNLPPDVQRALRPVTEHLEQFSRKTRDILLMSLLANYSALFGHVEFVYSIRRHSLNIAYVLKSDGGSGKSIMSLADFVTCNVNKYLQDESVKKRDEWTKQQMLWELEIADAKKQKRTPDWDMRPGDEPQLQLMNMPVNTSKSQLLSTFKATEGDGLRVFSSEINSFVSAVSKDYGQFADVFCKAIENEADDNYFKINGQPIAIQFIMLTIMMSGTDDQYFKLFPNITDGLVSRFLHQQGDPDTEWRSQRPPENIDEYTTMYDQMSIDAFNMWKWQRQFTRLRLVFTEEQWDRADALWDKTYTEFIRECGTKTSAIPKRHAFNQMRVAGVLTMLRLWGEHRAEFMSQDFNAATFNPTITCQDIDFQTAEEIISVLYKHLLAIFASKLNKEEQQEPAPAQWQWSMDAMQKLHGLIGEESFTVQDFANLIAGNPWNKSQNTAYRTVDALVKQRYLKRVKKPNPRRYRMTKSLLRKIRKK